jgi:hypothetical protein
LKLLLDNCVHRAVKGFFPGHETTTDKNIRNQHNLAMLPIPVIELASADTRIEGLLQLEPFCLAALGQTARYWFVSVHSDGSLELKADRTQNRTTS